MLTDQAVIDVSPPTHQGRRRFSVVLVAFVAACGMLLGPWNTADKANALAIAPVIAAITEAGALPASILEFTPPGFAITAAAALGWLAWDNREQLMAWGSDAWCWIQNCPTTNTPHSVDGMGTLEPESHSPTPYNVVAWNLTCSGNACTATTSCTQPKPPGPGWPDFCTPGNLGTSPGTGNLVSVCVAGPSAPAGSPPVLTGRTRGGVTTGVSVYNGPNNVAYPVPSPIKWTNAGSFNVCPVGYNLARAEWWNVGQPSTDMLHGYYSQGNVPTDSRIDTKCKRPDGTTYTVTGTVITDPTGTGASGAAPPVCQPGDVATSMDVFTRPTGDTVWANPQTVPLQEAPADQVPNFGDCLNTDGTANGTCKTAVFIQEDGVGPFVECAVGNPLDCNAWDAYAASFPGRVQCRYGTHIMPLTDCKGMEQAYYTGRRATDDGGTTWHAINPDGTPAPKPSPNPGPTPGPTPGPSPAPAPTNVHDPAFDPQPSNSSCWAGMISWNPLDWVYTPVKCVMTWAFVPPEGDYAAQLNAVDKTWGTTGPGRWFTAMGSLITATSPPGDGSCAGPAWSGTLPAGGGGFTVHPFSACADPVATVARVVKLGLTVLVWVGAGVVCLRLIGSAIGLNLNGIGSGGSEDA